MALAKALGVLPSFKAAYGSGNFEIAATLLRELKVIMTELDESQQETQSLARQVLELAVFMSIRTGEMKAFERNVAQLKPFILSISGEGPEAEFRRHIVGLLLIHLLTEARLAEFHSEVELLRPGDRTSPFVAFPLKLELFLMEGSYNKILAMRSSTPSDMFGPFMARLAGTVREQIADCAAASYPTLSLTAAQRMMTFESTAELASYIQQHRPEWSVQGQQIVFPSADGAPTAVTASSTSKRSDVDPQALIQNALHYATEVERII